MVLVTYGQTTYECSQAIKGPDYVHLMNEDNEPKSIIWVSPYRTIIGLSTDCNTLFIALQNASEYDFLGVISIDVAI